MDYSEKLRELGNRIITCRLCPRLVTYREKVARERPKRYSNENYWAKPLPGFGDVNARLVVIGLAPAAHGGNRTGRMFTGDSSGNTLMHSLYVAGFANKPTSERAGDGLELRDAYITAVVRCAPPENKPTRHEIENCLPYLVEELKLLRNMKVVVTLGRIAFDNFVKIIKSENLECRERLKFEHGKQYVFSGSFFGFAPPILLVSYHPSRQNTQTGRLTQEMLDEIFLAARRIIAGEGVEC